MAAITKMVGSFSGAASYSDGSYEHFNAEVDDNGVKYTFNQTESDSIIAQMHYDATWGTILDSVIESIPFVTSVAWEANETVLAKNVTDASFRLSLTFAFDDNNVYAVGVVYQDGQLITQMPPSSNILGATNLATQRANVEELMEVVMTSSTIA